MEPPMKTWAVLHHMNRARVVHFIVACWALAIFLYMLKCGGNLLIHVEVREQCQETKKSGCSRRSLDMVSPTKLKRLK